MRFLRCPRCGYVWRYRGKKQYAQCPNCKTSFSVAAHSVGEFIAYVSTPFADFHILAVKSENKVKIVVDIVKEEIETKEFEFNSETEAEKWIKEKLKIIELIEEGKQHVNNQ